MTSITNDPKMRMFFEFFESQGFKFIDADTGEAISVLQDEAKEEECQ